MEDDLTFLQMEHDLNFFCKWTTTSIFLYMEEDLRVFFYMEDDLKMFVNRRQPLFDSLGI